MNSKAVCVALALASSLAVAGPPPKGARGLPKGYTWETNFETAKLHAAESGKLLYIDFFTEW